MPRPRRLGPGRRGLTERARLHLEVGWDFCWWEPSEEYSREELQAIWREHRQEVIADFAVSFRQLAPSELWALQQFG